MYTFEKLKENEQQKIGITAGKNWGVKAEFGM